MAKLLSHHDKFHAHAILGLIALLHFAYRFGYLFVTQQESFTPGIWTAASLLVHFFLHLLSFQFELPRNRIWTKPMIWREFRVHNAIFAYRHLIGAAFGTWAPKWWYWSPDVWSIAAKVALVCAACYAADLATQKIGSLDKRTTNAMPYPKRTDQSVMSLAKLFYAKSQFAATALAAFGPPFLSFLSIFAIEIASFLMTLVRKGIIEDRTYHVVYAGSLFIMFPCMVATLHSGNDFAVQATFRAMCATFMSCELRINYRVDKYITWIVSIVAGMVVAEMIAMYVDIRYVAWPGMIWSASDTLYCLIKARNAEAALSKKTDNEANQTEASTEATSGEDAPTSGDEEPKDVSTTRRAKRSSTPEGRRAPAVASVE